MPTKEDLQQLLIEDLVIEARCNAYYDIAMLIQKYEKKVTRQHSDAKRKYDRMNMSTISKESSYKAFEEATILNYQISETLKLGKELLERTNEVFNERKNHKEKINTVAQQLVEEENSDHGNSSKDD